MQPAVDQVVVDGQIEVVRPELVVPTHEVKAHEQGVAERRGDHDRAWAVATHDRRYLFIQTGKPRLNRFRNGGERALEQRFDHQRSEERDEQQRLLTVLPRLVAEHDRHDRQRDQRREEPGPLLGDLPRPALAPQPGEDCRPGRSAEREATHEARDQAPALVRRLELVVLDEIGNPPRAECKLRPD